MNTYINEFSRLAQIEGFSYDMADEEITQSALKYLQLNGDTFNLVQSGNGEEINDYNVELASNLFMTMKAVKRIDNKPLLLDFLKAIQPVGRRMLPEQIESMYVVFSDEVAKAVRNVKPELKWQESRKEL
jgi:hypothetical protein